MKPLTVVGVGADGCVSLSSRAFNAVTRSTVLVGGDRQLAFFPDFAGTCVSLSHGLGSALDQAVELADEHAVCVLASGDPNFFGVAASLLKRVPAEEVEIIPHVSAVQEACARVGWSWQDATLLSVHGRTLEGLAARLRGVRKACLLTDPRNSPATIAAHLLAYGGDGWEAVVCEDLGGAAERVRRFDLPSLAKLQDVGPLNVLLLQRTDPGWRPPARFTGLHEDAFAKRMPRKGLITKREVRVLVLASLAIRPDAVVWDLGAGSGSVSVEASRLASEGRVFAVECDPQGVQYCIENTRTHGADNVTVVEGLAPDACESLPDPDAVFVGGSKGRLADIVSMALHRLRPGGRLVVSAVTFENVGQAYEILSDFKPEVTLVQVSRGAPLARYLRYEALNPIHLFAVTRPASPLTPLPTPEESS